MQPHNVVTNRVIGMAKIFHINPATTQPQETHQIPSDLVVSMELGEILLLITVVALIAINLIVFKKKKLDFVSKTLYLILNK